MEKSIQDKGFLNSFIEMALIAAPGESFAGGAIGIPDFARADIQQQDYAAALERCGVRVVSLPQGSEAGDGFAASAGVVTEHLAVIGGDGTGTMPLRQKQIASHLAGTRFLKFIVPPGKLDARDVLRAGDHFYISLSQHTNQEGAAQLAFYLKEFGYNVTMLDVHGRFPLGAAGTCLGDNRLIIREELALNYAFVEYQKIIVPYRERAAASCTVVNGTVILPASCPETLKAVETAGFRTLQVNVSEFEKMGGGLGCLSLRLQKNGNAGVALPASKTGKKAA